MIIRVKKFATAQFVFLFVFNCVVTTFGHAENRKATNSCPTGAIVDLSNLVESDSGFITDDGLSFPKDLVFRLRDGKLVGCVCDVKPCITVCPEKLNGTSLIANEVNYSAFPRVYKTDSTIDDEGVESNPDKRFHIFVSEPECALESSYYLDPEEYASDDYRLVANGSLMLLQGTEKDSKPFFLDYKNYCFEQRSNEPIYTPRVCSPHQSESETQPIEAIMIKAKYIAALVSVPFLLATVIVYSTLSELKNIHGTTLICYLSCLIVTYVTLAIDRIPEADFSAGPFCLFLGFTIYLSFLASFFWLNVMCFDMWWRFGGLGILPSSSTQNDRKRFVYYSIYAWGIPALMTVIAVAIEFSPFDSESIIRPGFRDRACWFDSRSSETLYFYGPVGIIIACNICLFILTSLKMCKYIKNTEDYQINDLDDENKCHEHNKHWFKLYFQLFIVMGMTWTTEVISWYWESPKYLWLITDMINSLQGILIFVILVLCKKNVLSSLSEIFKRKFKSQSYDQFNNSKIYPTVDFNDKNNAKNILK